LNSNDVINLGLHLAEVVRYVIRKEIRIYEIRVISIVTIEDLQLSSS